jgi:hypothetical protein
MRVVFVQFDDVRHGLCSVEVLDGDPAAQVWRLPPGWPLVAIGDFLARPPLAAGGVLFGSAVHSQTFNALAIWC